jgi:hypothetical protein
MTKKPSPLLSLYSWSAFHKKNGSIISIRRNSYVAPAVAKESKPEPMSQNYRNLKIKACTCNGSGISHPLYACFVFALLISFISKI